MGKSLLVEAFRFFSCFRGGSLVVYIYFVLFIMLVAVLNRLLVSLFLIGEFFIGKLEVFT